MDLETLKSLLAAAPNQSVQLVLPGGSSVPGHFHVTEVGQVRKDFIDCGGEVRQSVVCLIQAWVANDMEHRISSDKLLKILTLANKVVESDKIPVEIEYQESVISQFPLESLTRAEDGSVMLTLGMKFTDCLSKDKCGIPGDYIDERQGGDAECCGPDSGTDCCGPDSNELVEPAIRISSPVTPLKFE